MGLEGDTMKVVGHMAMGGHTMKVVGHMAMEEVDHMD